jgi:hypothetical protein
MKTVLLKDKPSAQQQFGVQDEQLAKGIQNEV